MKNFIYGFHSIIACIKNDYSKVITIYYDQKRKDSRLTELTQLAKTNNIPIKAIDSSKLDQLVTEGKSHQGVAAETLTPNKFVATTLEEFIHAHTDKKEAVVLILDGITDPQNLGAIIRSADCFNVDAIIIPKNNSANPNNATVAKASSGAIFNLPIIIVNNLSSAIEKLKQQAFWIAGTALDDTAVNLFDFKFSGKLAWVVGSEGRGIRRLVQENCDYLVTIPMLGKTQSLNVSVATGIVLAHTRLIQHNNLR